MALFLRCYSHVPTAFAPLCWPVLPQHFVAVHLTRLIPCKLSAPLSPLLATDPKKCLLTPIIATLPKTPSRKSFACHTSKTPRDSSQYAHVPTSQRFPDLSPFFSHSCALFSGRTKPHLFSSQCITHSSPMHGGVGEGILFFSGAPWRRGRHRRLFSATSHESRITSHCYWSHCASRRTVPQWPL